MSVSSLGVNEAPPPGCSQRGGARKAGASGWYDYSVPPPLPAILRVGLVVVHHFPDATYTSASASVTDAKGRADSGPTLRGRYSTKYNFNWDLLKVLFV